MTEPIADDQITAILQLALYEIGLGTKSSVRNEIGVYRATSLADPRNEDADVSMLEFIGMVHVQGADVSVARHRREFVPLEVSSPNFFRMLFRYFGVENYRIDMWYEEDHRPYTIAVGLQSPGRLIETAR